MSQDDTSKTNGASSHCKEAEDASSKALEAVVEIFGDDQRCEDEITIVRRWKNGGKAALRDGLRRAGFHELPLKDVNNA